MQGTDANLPTSHDVHAATNDNVRRRGLQALNRLRKAGASHTRRMQFLSSESDPGGYRSK